SIWRRKRSGCQISSSRINANSSPKRRITLPSGAPCARASWAYWLAAAMSTSTPPDAAAPSRSRSLGPNGAAPLEKRDNRGIAHASFDKDLSSVRTRSVAWYRCHRRFSHCIVDYPVGNYLVGDHLTSNSLHN